MTIAGLINVAMLVMAASTFYKSGLHHVESLEVAHKTLVPLLGSAASALFALALLASGLSSSAVGTLSGQVVMQGFLGAADPARRAPARDDGAGVHHDRRRRDPSRTLVLSQVVLSFGIPFALVPLSVLHEPPDVMGVLVNARATTVAAIAVAV